MAIKISKILRKLLKSATNVKPLDKNAMKKLNKELNEFDKINNCRQGKAQIEARKTWVG